MSKKSILKILLPSVALSFGGFASMVKAYTLQEAVSHTLATSPDLFIEVNLRDEVDKQLRESYAGYLPTLDMTGGVGKQYANNATTRAISSDPEGTLTLNRTEFGVLASQMLFDGFGVYHDVQGHKARVKAESWRVNGTAQDVALAVAEAYLDVILDRELTAIGRENLEIHERIGSQIQKRSESGIGRKADLDQSAARIALAHTNFMASEGKLRDSETSFLRQVGVPVPRVLVRPQMPQPFPRTERDAVELGLKYHPTLHASVEDWLVTKASYKGSRAAFMPRLDLNLSHTRNHNVDGSAGDSDENAAMLRLRWNLFSGGKDLARLCETAYKMQEAQEVTNRAQRQVVQAVRFAWNLYHTNLLEMKYFKAHVDASLSTMDAYQKQFNIGQRTLLDLLDAQNELYGARIAYARAKMDELRGMYRLLNATGVLTEYLKVELPKQAVPKPNGVLDGRMRFFDKTTMLFDY